MSTAAVSSNSIYQELHAYFQQRGSDQQALGKALQAGDIAGAQTEFNAIQTLGQSGPSATGNAYLRTKREADFTAVGQALHAGDLAGAQKAFAQLQATFHKAAPQVQQQADQNPAVVVNIGGSSSGSSASGAGSQASAAGSAAPGAGAEIVVNLGNVTSGEQITIGVSNPSTGGEQVTIGVANQQGQTAEQITLNLNQSSNQQIVLNLFNGTSNSSAQSSGLSLTA